MMISEQLGDNDGQMKRINAQQNLPQTIPYLRMAESEDDIDYGKEQRKRYEEFEMGF